MDPRGTVGRIYKEEHYILLQKNMKALGLVVSEKKFFYVLPMTNLVTSSLALLS